MKKSSIRKKSEIISHGKFNITLAFSRTSARENTNTNCFLTKTRSSFFIFILMLVSIVELNSIYCTIVIPKSKLILNNYVSYWYFLFICNWYNKYLVGCVVQCYESTIIKISLASYPFNPFCWYNFFFLYVIPSLLFVGYFWCYILCLMCVSGKSCHISTFLFLKYSFQRVEIYRFLILLFLSM